MGKEEGVNSSETDCGRTPLAEVLDQISCIACINCFLGQCEERLPYRYCTMHKFC